MLTPERRVELRRRIRFGREMDHTNLSIAFDDISALLDAADERDALAAVAREADQMHAVMLAAEGELLGDSPELPRWERLLLNGLTLPELAKNVADERDRLLAVADTLGRVNGEYAMEIHRCREALGVDEDTDPHHAAQALAAAVKRVRALHVADGEGFCRCCDYMTQHPCETNRALDGAGEAHAYLPITEDADGLTCDICGAELADWAAADEHVEQHEGWVG